MNDRSVRWITAIVLAAIGFYGFSRLDFTNSIRHFLPDKNESELVDLSIALIDSPLARRMVFSIGGGQRRRQIAAQLTESLRAHPEVAWIESAIDDEALRGIYELYFDRRVYLGSDRPATEIPAMTAPRALEQRADELLRRLAQPDGMLTARSAPDDPFGLFDRIVERIRRARPEPSVDLRSAKPGDDYETIVLGLASSPFDSERQAELLAYIDTEFARLDSSGDHLIEISGVNRIAIATEQSIRADANFISAVSISAVCALFWWVFRSLRHLAISILTPLSGFTVAIAVALSGSDPVHGITLGFGFVLIGVAIDYPIHLMNHHSLSTPGTLPRETTKRIQPSLLLSGLTTTFAFMALALSDFPGLREMGTFAAIGIPVSLLVTLFAIPAFMRPSTAPTSTQLALAQRLDSLIRWLSPRRRLPVAIFAACATIAIAGIPRLNWEDDPATLMAVSPELLAESERVRQRVVDFDGGRFVVGLAADREAALALNDQIHERLEGAIAAGNLDGVNSIHAFLFSEALQRRNLEAWQSIPDLGSRVDQSFESRGFRAGSFRSFSGAVSNPVATPLGPRDFAGSPLERVLDSLFELDGRWAAVTYLRGVSSGDSIRAALAGLDGAHYVDQKEIIGEIYQRYRRSTLRMMVLGCVIVFVVLQARYRSLRRGTLSFVSAALAALSTFGTFGLLGIPVNVVSAISTMVVLGLGVDYGIFAVDASLDPERLGSTLSSILVSSLTSVCVFGALALSEQPALRAIGQTAATGILFALTLSPGIFVLARRKI